jgi:hypothetical protein
MEHSITVVSRNKALDVETRTIYPTFADAQYAARALSLNKDNFVFILIDNACVIQAKDIYKLCLQPTMTQ